MTITLTLPHTVHGIHCSLCESFVGAGSIHHCPKGGTGYIPPSGTTITNPPKSRTIEDRLQYIETQMRDQGSLLNRIHLILEALEEKYLPED
jgi:hypothetical protein